MVKYVVLRCVFKGLSTFGGIKSIRVEMGKTPRAPFRVFFRPSRVLGRKKGVALVRGRIQSGLPLTRRADPSCPAGCQDQAARAPGATFCDMVKYVLLRGKSGGWSTFGGIKSVPERKWKKKSSFFWAFFRPSRVLDQKKSLRPPQKAVLLFPFLNPDGFYTPKSAPTPTFTS